MSRAYLYGEKYLAPELYEDVNITDGIEMMGDNQSAWCGYEWDNHRVAFESAEYLVGRRLPAGSRRHGDSDLGNLRLGSAHPGSLNMAYCDGSVRTVGYDVDRDIHRFQANRLDGQAH